jgi:iron(III) transport system ATP-binding protein
VRDIKSGVATVELTPALAVAVARAEGLAVGELVDVAVRPESIRLAAPQSGTPATVTNHVFLGNISEYEITLRSGAALRVQTHPTQQFKVGEQVAIEIDGSQCSAFPRARGETAEQIGRDK